VNATMRERLRLPALVAVSLFALGCVGIASNLSSSDAADRHDYEARPQRAEPPTVVTRGRTDKGQAFSVRYSRSLGAGRFARDETCVSFQLSVSSTVATSEIGAPGPAEMCGPPPEAEPVAFGVYTSFVDLQTGKFTDTPQHFLFGYTEPQASKLILKAKDERRHALTLTAVKDGDAKVFAGEIPEAFPPGPVELESREADGGALEARTVSPSEQPKVP